MKKQHNKTATVNEKEKKKWNESEIQAAGAMLQVKLQTAVFLFSL